MTDAQRTDDHEGDAHAADDRSADEQPTDEHQADHGHRVTTLELFFDLVFVFAITQVSGMLSHDAMWGGILRGLLVLGALWWTWSSYAWLTNALDPEEGGIRILVFGAIAALLIVALATPGAFGTDALVFGIAYLVVRLLHLVLVGIADGRVRDQSQRVARLLPAAIVAPGLLIVAAFADDTPRVGLWGVALAILYLGPLVYGIEKFRVSPDHFVERFGLIIIIALGESVVSIGVGAAGLPLDAGLITGALLGITVAGCLWWLYFDWVVYVGQARLIESTGRERAVFARDMYSYLHLPMVAGIVLFAFGVKAVLEDVSAPLGTVTAFGLFGGIALYLLAHVVVRLRLGGGLGRGRPVATVVLLGLILVAGSVPALVSLAVVAGVCVALIAYEVTRHRESRAWIRQRREGFTLAEVRALEPPRGRR